MWQVIGRWFGQATSGVTRDQISGLVQRFLAVAVGFAVGKKWIPAEYANDIVVGVGVLLLALWSISVNRKAALAQSVANQGSVVVTDAATAKSAPSENVVPFNDAAALKRALAPVASELMPQNQHPTYPTGAVGGGKVA